MPPILLGTYIPPAVRIGARVYCRVRRQWCRVTSYTDAPISWPRGQPLKQRGGVGLVVNATLERASISEFEPTEGNERELFILSPFAIPRQMSMDVTPARVSEVRLNYSGGTGDVSVEPLDDMRFPAVTLSVSKHDRKVLALRFNPQVEDSGLMEIAEPLEQKVASIQNTPKRLSYRMTAQVIRHLLMPLVQRVRHRV